MSDCCSRSSHALLCPSESAAFFDFQQPAPAFSHFSVFQARCSPRRSFCRSFHACFLGAPGGSASAVRRNNRTSLLSRKASLRRRVLSWRPRSRRSRQWDPWTWPRSSQGVTRSLVHLGVVASPMAYCVGEACSYFVQSTSWS